MKTKKKANGLEFNTRQIELFNEYYDTNPEDKTVTYSLHFEKATDLLDNKTGNPKKPIFSNDVLEEINSLIEKTPFIYKIKINLEITDYESFEPKEIIKSFNDTLELNQYAARKSRQKKEILAANLILVGIILLFFMVITKNNEWFGGGTKTDIAVEVINIAAWVFVWEAVTMLFLEHSEQNIFALKIRRRVNQITMRTSNNEKPLAVEEANQIFGNWENEGKIKRTGKMFLLISSFAFLFSSFYSLYQVYSYTIENEFNLINFIIMLISGIIYAIILLSAGLGGISLYKGKKNKLSNLVGPYAILISISIIFIIYTAIKNQNSSLIFSGITTTIINILYTIGYFIDKGNKIKDKYKDK